MLKVFMNSGAWRTSAGVRPRIIDSRAAACTVLGAMMLSLAGARPALAAHRKTNKPPTVRVTVVPASGVTGTAVTIDGSATTDPEGAIASWDYVFGDGTHQAGTGPVVAVKHTYTAAGTYTIRLTATDAALASATATASVSITAANVQTSADGTEVPPAAQIIDTSASVWTLAADLRVLRNGVQAANGYASRIFFYQQTVYVYGTDSQWWRWTGSGWAAYGTTKPGAQTTPSESASGTQIPPATQIVDSGGAVWTLAVDRRVLRNGVQAADGYGTSALWLNKVLYVLGLDALWYQWNGAGWVLYGQTAPGTTVPGYTVQPGQSIQAVVDTAPEGASILLRSGLHRLPTAIVPKSRQVLVGESGTVLSGAQRLTDFWRSGNLWVVSGQVQRGVVLGSVADEVCSTAQPRCGYPEDLFIDNVLLKHVTALADVAPGHWYFDYVNDQIYIADDPTGRTVETSITPAAFQGYGTGVTIRGLVIEKFATPTAEAAVNGRGAGWIIEDSELRFNHFAGIRTVDHAVARRNLVHHNGAFGFIGSGRGILVESNEIAYNNIRGYNAYWGAGGSKWVYTDGLVVRGNFSHHNFGPGLWTDIDNVDVLYENNRVEDNDLSGIFHEIGYAAVIRNNSISRNGRIRPFTYWIDGAGILVAGSTNVEVYSNTLIDNWQGITGLEGHRGSGIYGPWVLQNLYVHDNNVTQTGTLTAGSGRSGIVDTSGFEAFSSQRNNRWAHDTYSLPASQPYSFIWMGTDLNESKWTGYGQDVTGTFNRR
jgi:PKD repeat protein